MLCLLMHRTVFELMKGAINQNKILVIEAFASDHIKINLRLMQCRANGAPRHTGVARKSLGVPREV